MEINGSSLPVRSKYMNSKPTAKASEATNFNSKARSSLLRQEQAANNQSGVCAASTRNQSHFSFVNKDKRVFGTARNPNVRCVPSKTDPTNPAKVKARKAEKPSGATSSPPRTVAEAKSSSEKNAATKPKKKSVSFDVVKVGKDLPNEELQTPVKSTPEAAAKPRRSATPYYTADKCSKCRFDKLETAAYWLAQIKSAEFVSKHSVSAAFFGSIKGELKKYITRHEHLHEEEQWKILSSSYGVLREEFNISASGEEDEQSLT
ncbi:uncharacterized protein LOC127239367 [Andrographis paniculata]|uniref:uncharacterized protein LOC127239367 n=1 Tax=Andrographis paniculata TaxID=175694 RepID=UPI0021E7107B|nr:uncharacterized protein LOC127239367 [Andrographis paniculata]XP_051113433.1 uncharacterized protein LOC127239367 [Andrographis paniculata]